MDSLPSSTELPFETRAGSYSATFLLERALEYVQHELLAEGVVYLRLARERLAPGQVYVANLLDAFIEGCTSFQHVQHLLQEASRHFAVAYTEQQTRIADFTALLPTLIRDLHAADILSGLASTAQHQQALRLPAQEPLSSPATRSSRENHARLPELSITCFGHFEVNRLGKPVNLCSSRSGQSILRYLIARPDSCATSDVLQSLFWPDDEPGMAQNKLHLAISALRRSLNEGCAGNPGSGYILCKQGAYRLNPAVTMRTDVDEFLQCYQAGKRESRETTMLYERACHLYKGPFLVEDLYADWSFFQRERLSQIYLSMCRTLTNQYLQELRYDDAAKWASAILRQNHCDEMAHQYLIRIHIAQGRRSEALQQYQYCERLLHQELGVLPLPETTALLAALYSDRPPTQQQ